MRSRITVFATGILSLAIVNAAYASAPNAARITRTIDRLNSGSGATDDCGNLLDPIGDSFLREMQSMEAVAQGMRSIANARAEGRDQTLQSARIVAERIDVGRGSQKFTEKCA